MDGLTSKEMSIIKTSVKELAERKMLGLAFEIVEKRFNNIRKMNAEHGPLRAMAGFVISDNLGEGIQGVLNHADGKYYDSKSQYTRAVVASGARIVGNDYNNAEYKTPAERGIRGDFNVRPQLKQAIEKAMR